MKMLAVFMLSLVAGCYGQTLNGDAFVNQTVLFGNDATMTCTAVGTSSILPMTFKKQYPDGIWTTITSESTALNSTKHSISGSFTLTVNGAVFTDEGGYQCTVDALSFSYTSYLIVADIPDNATIYWGDNSQTTPQDQAANLTCESTTSHPPATFRWFKGTTEVTSGITYPTPSTDNNGYGTAISYLEVTPTATDAGVGYSCEVDIGDMQSVLTRSLTVSFSGAGNIFASVSLVFAAVFAALRI